MPTKIQHLRNQFKRNAPVITASIITAAVTAALYLKYIVAAVQIYGAQGPMIINLPKVF